VIMSEQRRKHASSKEDGNEKGRSDGGCRQTRPAGLTKMSRERTTRTRHRLVCVSMYMCVCVWVCVVKRGKEQGQTGKHSGKSCDDVATTAREERGVPSVGP
jgi:hypothetical protein